MNTPRTITFVLPIAMLWSLSACRPSVPADEDPENGDSTAAALSQATDIMAAPPPPAPDSTRSIRLGLLLDTSNSMDGLINQAKAQLWSIVTKLSEARCEGLRPTVQVALYEYGNDGLPARGNYIRQVMGFTPNMDEVSKQLFTLTTNGGSEYCGAVIARSVDDLEWGNSDADLRMLVIAGNEPFTQGPVNFGGACERARQKGIVVNTIYCGDHSEGVSGSWYAGALAAKGSYFSIDQNAVTQQIASPYDDELAQLEYQWNTANVYYGKEGEYNSANMLEQDKNASSLGWSSSGKRREYKMKNSYLGSTWDLTEVQAEHLDSVLRKTDRATLPDRYRAMDQVTLRNEVLRLQQEKKGLSDRITTLTAQRNQYVAEQTKAVPGADQLENSILAAIETSARQKGMSFEEEVDAKKLP